MEKLCPPTRCVSTLYCILTEEIWQLKYEKEKIMELCLECRAAGFSDIIIFCFCNETGLRVGAPTLKKLRALVPS